MNTPTPKTILVTGGAGYIGSHTVRALRHNGYSVIVLDNLSRGHEHIVSSVLRETLIIGDVGNKSLVKEILSGRHPQCHGQRVSGVIHFAAYAYIGESTIDPLAYYRNNVLESLLLLEAIVEDAQEEELNPVPIVVSSTCATYGIPVHLPIDEDSPKQPINPYGKSKLMVEQILVDFWDAYRLPGVILRYFNAAGACKSGDIGELHNPETHLIPLAIQAAMGKIPHLAIYGSDYPTDDGTCLRDFIHVCDLASAHCLALQKVFLEPGLYDYNLGIGKAFSVLEVVQAVESVTGLSVPVKIAPKRKGDPPVLISSNRKAVQELGWKPEYRDIIQIIETAWQWHHQLCWTQ